jgi:predicted Zn-dependent protease
VTRGALKSMRDEAELAGVLAHELTHVIEQHGLKAAKAAAAQAGYLQAVSSVLQTDSISKFIGAGISAITVNGYDKPQEYAADAGAVDLLVAAGYDPHSYGNYLSHLAAMQQSIPQTRPGEVAANVQKIMSTHPGIADRYRVVADKIAAAGNPGGSTMKARFRTYVMQ